MRRTVILGLVAALAGLLAAPGAGSRAADGPTRSSGQYVDLSPVALPVVDGGRLRNYVFVTVRLQLNPRVDPMKVRDREPYLRDALVRIAHRRPFTVAGDWSSIDIAKLKSVMFQQAQTLVGPGIVTGVALTGAPTPQHRALSHPPRT